MHTTDKASQASPQRPGAGKRLIHNRRGLSKHRNAAMGRHHILQNEKIDCAVVFSSSMASYLLPGKYLAPSRVLFDMVDLDSDKWQQYANTTGVATSWIYRREAKKLLELERLAAEKFAFTYLVSPYEVQSFSRLAPESVVRIRALSNGVNLDYFSPGAYVSPFPRNVTPIAHGPKAHGLLAKC